MEEGLNGIVNTKFSSDRVLEHALSKGYRQSALSYNFTVPSSIRPRLRQVFPDDVDFLLFLIDACCVLNRNYKICLTHIYTIRMTLF